MNLKNNYTRTVEHSLERDNMMGSVKTIPSTLKENSVIKKKKSSHLKSQSKLKHPRTAMSRKRNYFVGQKPSKSESWTTFNPYAYNNRTSFKDIYQNHKDFYEWMGGQVSKIRLKFWIIIK